MALVALFRTFTHSSSAPPHSDEIILVLLRDLVRQYSLFCAAKEPDTDMK